MPNKNHGKKMRPRGAFSTPSQLLLVETSYISPEPKRCAERKVLNCLMRIIAKLPPFVGVILQNSATTNLRLCTFFRGKGRPLLYPILPPRGEISRGLWLHALNFNGPLFVYLLHELFYCLRAAKANVVVCAVVNVKKIP